MISAYYGQDKPLQEIQKYFSYSKNGVSAFQLGEYFTQEGYRTHLYSQNPFLFSMQDRKKNRKSLIQKLYRIEQTTKIPKVRAGAKSCTKFIRAGGVVHVKIPDLLVIEKALQEKKPIIALLMNQFLTDATSKLNFHFVVITGIDTKKIYTNDPAKDIREYAHSDFLFGLYASAAGDPDNASLITIGK